MKSDHADRATRLLSSVTGGDEVAAEGLVPCVYEELREIAGRLMRNDRSATIQPTELIHEAYLRLIHHDEDSWESRVHFKRVAARAMRTVLIDRARARMSHKRGAGQRPVTLDENVSSLVDEAESLLFVQEGLEQLRAFDPQLAEIVELRFFGEMTIEEVAVSLGVSKRTVDRGWRLARSWWIAEYAEVRGDDGME